MKRNKKLAVKIGQKKNNWTMFMYVAIHTDLNDIHKKSWALYIAPSVTLVYLFGVSLILYGTATPKSQVAVSKGLSLSLCQKF